MCLFIITHDILVSLFLSQEEYGVVGVSGCFAVGICLLLLKAVCFSSGLHSVQSSFVQLFQVVFDFSQSIYMCRQGYIPIHSPNVSIQLDLMYPQSLYKEDEEQEVPQNDKMPWITPSFFSNSTKRSWTPSITLFQGERSFLKSLYRQEKKNKSVTTV